MWISPSLMGSSPVFPASFPAKINVFRRERPIGFPISCCFFIKVNHIWCLPRPLPASPHLRVFDLVLGIYEVLISPISHRRVFTRPMSLRQPIYEVLISFIVLFSAWSFRFLFIGKLCKALLLFTAFCEFHPLLWGAAPFFLPLFRQKATFFVETAQSDSQYLVAFLWKWITFGVRLRPLPASPIYEVLISFWGFRASVRDTNLVNQLPASRQQRDQNLVHWSRPKADWVRSRPRK